jgi:hypothetical protein
MELRNSILAGGRITEFQIPIARDIASCLVIDLSEDNRFVFSTWGIPPTKQARRFMVFEEQRRNGPRSRPASQEANWVRV